MLALFLLALLAGPPPARGQSPEAVLLNLESIKLEMERIRQEAGRLGLLTQREIQIELDLLGLEMERAQREFEMELVRFQEVAETENYETLQVVEKFKVTVDNLFLEIQKELQDQQKALISLHAEARGATAPSEPGIASEEVKSALARARRATTASKLRPVKPPPAKPPPAKLVLPRVKTLTPDQPLVLDSVQRTVPALRDLQAQENLENLGDLTYAPKVYFIPRPGQPLPSKTPELDRHLQALEKYSGRIQNVKVRLRREPDNPRPLWLDLGGAYLETERYFNSVPAATSGKILKSDLMSGLILGGYQAALLAFKTALWLEPNDPDTHLTISSIYDEIRDGQSAVNHLARARFLYLGQERAVQAEAVEIKLHALLKKYPKIWVCPPGRTEGCEQNAGRHSVGGDLFESNLGFYQTGTPPTVP